MENIGQKLTLQRHVDSYRSGWTIVEYLSHRFKYHSPERWAMRVRDGLVQVNAASVAPDAVVNEGDVVSYTIFHDEPEVDFAHTIIHEDDDLLAVAKSGNVPVHACGVYIRNTLIAHLKNQYGEHLNLAHRLDRETSGVLLLTKNREAARAVSRQFEAGEVTKRYLTVVHGRVPTPSFEVDAPIGKTDEAHRLDEDRLTMRGVRSSLREDLPNSVPKRRVDFAGGKPARTLFNVLRLLGDRTLLEAWPLSGRTNQIRVHLHHAGFPVVGDKVYRAPGISGTDVFPRHALHCARMNVRHPATGQMVSLEAPLSADMKGLIQTV